MFVSYLELVTDQAIEETDVGIPEPGQEDVLLDIGRFASELGEGTLLLGLEGLDLGRAQSLKTKGGTELGRSSSAYSKKKGDKGTLVCKDPFFIGLCSLRTFVWACERCVIRLSMYRGGVFVYECVPWK